MLWNISVDRNRIQYLSAFVFCNNYQNKFFSLYVHTMLKNTNLFEYMNKEHTVNIINDMLKPVAHIL